MLPDALHVLIVDDDNDTRANLKEILELDDYVVDLAATVREALTRTDWEQISVILLDRKLPDGSAESLLPQLRRLAPHAAVMIVTGYGDIQGAVAAIRQGAADYILKPIDPQELRTRLARIAEHHRAERELEIRERILRSVMETIRDAVMVVDEQGKVLLFNPAVQQLIGPVAVGAGPEHWPQFGRASYSERPISSSSPVAGEGRRAGHLFSLEQLALSRALRGEDVIDIEEFIDKPNGTASVWVSANASPLRDDHGALRGAVIVWRDITERKRSEEKVLQSARLAAIGQMMAGLAHESGNALARSQSCLEMLAWEVEDRPAALDLINRVQKAHDDLRQLYEEVRGYAAPLRLEREVWNLAGIWRQAWENLSVLRRGRDAVLKEFIEAMDLACLVDPFRLEQVFRNILENSLAACADPVRIEIHTSATILEGHAAVQLAMRDNGPGLSPEQKKRIFEPFFTTKTKGTGLGMAIAKRIVDAHGGVVAIGSGPPPGAEILITLPRDTS